MILVKHRETTQDPYLSEKFQNMNRVIMPISTNIMTKNHRIASNGRIKAKAFGYDFSFGTRGQKESKEYQSVNPINVLLSGVSNRFAQPMSPLSN